MEIKHVALGNDSIHIKRILIRHSSSESWVEIPFEVLSFQQYAKLLNYPKCPKCGNFIGPLNLHTCSKNETLKRESLDDLYPEGDI